MIDLRSDTVTRPTAAMREAMARAEVGDDVFGEDPTVRALEETTADLVGTEAALFVTSGTMSNQLAIALHTRPGDEVVVGEGAHVYVFESGAGPALSGVQFAVAGAGGFFDGDDVKAAAKPVAYWHPQTSLVCLEITHNRAGGRVFPADRARSAMEAARALGLGLHLDGARLWNAAARTGTTPKALAAGFDTVSVCFSKGLGAPVGSALCTTRANVERARRLRKMWGGGMRQAGVIAAAALHALGHHRERLVEDHENAARLAAGLSKIRGVSVDVALVETNIVNVDVLGCTAEAVARACRARGLAINPSGPTKLRAVTHLDVDASGIDAAIRIFAEGVAEATP